MNSSNNLHLQLIQRYRDHKRWAENKTKWYKPMGYILAISIPLLAALITALLAKDVNCFNWNCGPAYISLALAFLSIFQSILKPNERFIFFAGLCIELEEWHFNFQIGYEQIIKKASFFKEDSEQSEKPDTEQEKMNEEELLKFLKEQNMLLSEIGRRMASNTLPSGKKS